MRPNSGTDKDPNRAPSDEDGIQVGPWLWILGIIAVVIGLLSGLLMSQATFIR